MDSVVHLAVEEICAAAADGLNLLSLWSMLQSPLVRHGLPLCPNVKAALWSNLLSFPGLQFQADGTSYDSQDTSIQSVEKCEQINLKIIASECLRDEFLGLYDVHASGSAVDKKQRSVLERLAKAKSNGITQSELAKELKMKGNNIFYILKKLETRGLVVRQSTVLKTKEACSEGENKSSCNVTTNMVFLYRYAKHFGFQQRIEIFREDKTFSDECDNGDVSGSTDFGFRQEHVEDDVQVRDFLPALRAVCDKLEKADRKVLVVSDIKRDLGYREASGHRAWRRIHDKLRAAGIVEDCATKVRGKEVKCLRLLKKFSPKHFEPNSCKQGNDELDAEQQKLGRRAQITDQLVELPIEHQIYDMIDMEGSNGLTITEIYSRLGLRHKQYYDRLLDMSARFGVHFKAERRNRGVAYRAWTSRNFNPELPNLVSCFPQPVSREIIECGPCPLVWEADNSNPLIQDVHASTSKDVISAYGTSIEAEISYGSTNNEDNRMLMLPISTSEASLEVSNAELPTENTIIDALQCETSLALSIAPRRRRSYREYPCLTLEAATTLMEHQILEILEEEKILIKAELHRRLNRLQNVDKEKASSMDSKTLQRRLSKLQLEGMCKCINFKIPAITNCSEKRKVEVVLHSSISTESPEVVDQIHEKVRSFEMQIRRQSSPQSRKSVPMLDCVERIPVTVQSDCQAEQAEARRINGFVQSKMVRTKLLHGFLWDYISSSSGWGDLLSLDKNRHNLTNPHSTSKLFGLDAAIKAMPLELFLQVVGSTQKFEDMMDKCKKGLRLSDLSVQEYRCFMNTRATGRVSWLIDVLLRLKLIRLVRLGLADGEKVADTTLTHALELKPYIEEPVSIVSPSFHFIFPDLRPQIRHDFVLSSKKAVDEYWSTLEYCYAAANSDAALHAFPGSAVHEVFLPRSWGATRVMTTDQRAELLKRVVFDDPHRKLSMDECQKISRDLNLTQEQVLRIYHDRCQQRIRLSEDTYTKDPVTETLSRTCSSSRKRKRPLKGNSLKDERFSCKGRSLSSHLTDRQNSFFQTLEDHGGRMQTADEQEPIEESENDQFIGDNCTTSNQMPGCRRRFSWTEDAERQLVIEYARHRAARGANNHRIDWTSLANLPALPETCRRRMALLNKNPEFRKALMRLCNILAERYAKKLEKFQNMLNLENTGVFVREPIQGNCDENVGDPFEHTVELGSEECWDNFEESDIKMALNDVLRYRRVAKLNSSNLAGSDEWYAGQEPRVAGSIPPAHLIQENEACHRSKLPTQKSRSRRIAQNYNKLSKEGNKISRRVYESVAVSNAAELFKLIFLSTSISPEASNSLAETLRHYSQHDLFAAFSYLRENKIMIGGDGSTPFSLSQEFLHSISLSPFPTNTGKRAIKFSCWLAKRENDLMEGGSDLPTDLQCGDIFHLCALVSKAELLITPCLPEVGIGEPEDSRTSKRRIDSSEVCGSDRSKKLRTSMPGESEIISRRGKGFPGIRLSLSLITVPRMETLGVFKGIETSGLSPSLGKGENNPTDEQVRSYSSLPDACDSARRNIDNCDINQIAASADESPWETMSNYAVHVYSSLSHEGSSPFQPELFRTICLAIQTSGDQGLTMKDFSKILNLSGQTSEIVVDALEAFGRAFKVCAYDSVHIVDTLYRPKYVLSSVSEPVQIHGRNLSEDFAGQSIASNCADEGSSIQDEMRNSTHDIHRVTILNHPKELFELSSDIQSVPEFVNDTHFDMSSRANQTVKTDELHSYDSHLFRPILPWMNGDGTINELVYKGLVRRVIGIVMQNPGILEDDIIMHMRALNPQNCRKLLATLILDNHIIVRSMQQASIEPPFLLGSTFGICGKKPKVISRKHLFANPMSSALL